MSRAHASQSVAVIASSLLALASWPSPGRAQDVCYEPVAPIASGLTLGGSASGDLDGDGDRDIAVQHASARSPGLYVLSNNGDGTFAAPVFYAGHAVPMAIVDVDADGARDVVSVKPGAMIAVRLNQGDGTLGGEATYPTGNPAAKLAMGDLDGDGDLDVATTNSSTLTQSVLLNQGAGAFGAPVLYATAPGTFGTHVSLDVELGDVDGDGDLDLCGLVTDITLGVTHFTSNSYLTLRKNSGNGTFGVCLFTHHEGMPWSMTLDDFDGDGDLDLGAPDEYNERTRLFRNSGDGTFVPSSICPTAAAQWIESADLDGDGDLDWTVVSSTGTGVRFLTNDGSGTFVASPAYVVGTGLGAVTPSHLFGDARPEIYAIHSAAGGHGLAVVKSCQTTGGFRYCFGDGSGAACPCQNPGVADRGCGNIVFPQGAQLSATGSSRVSDDTLVLKSEGMSGAQSWYFQATGQDAVPFGRGILCIGGALLRVGQKSVVGGSSTNPSGVDLPLSVKGAIPPSGGTRYYQVSYRHANPVCTPAPVSNTNRTNGLAIVWTP